MDDKHFEFYWSSNEDWFYYDENQQPHMKDDAPDQAKESFKAYCKQQKELLDIQKKKIEKKDNKNLTTEEKYFAYYWSSNKDWYYYDSQMKPHLKDDVPVKVIESFKAYKKQLYDMKHFDKHTRFF